MNLADLGNHLWQSTLFAFIVISVLCIFRKIPGKMRHTLAVIALLKFILPAGMLSGVHEVLWTSIEADEGNVVEHVLTAPEKLGQHLVKTLHVFGPHGIEVASTQKSFVAKMGIPLVSVWGAVAGFLCLWWLLRYRNFCRLLTEKSIPIDDTRLKQRVAKLAQIMHVQVPKLRYLPGNLEPGVFGVWRPKILLPENLLKVLSDDELDAVFMHELMHIKRKDNLINLLQAGVGICFWFHPLLWILNRMITAESERAIDEEVVRLSSRQEIYASGLIKTAQFSLGLKMPAFSGMTARKIPSRVKAILENRPPRFVKTKSAIIFSGILWALTMICWGGSTRFSPIENTQKNVVSKEKVKQTHRHTNTLREVTKNHKEVFSQTIASGNNSLNGKKISYKIVGKSVHAKADHDEQGHYYLKMKIDGVQCMVSVKPGVLVIGRKEKKIGDYSKIFITVIQDSLSIKIDGQEVWGKSILPAAE